MATSTPTGEKITIQDGILQVPNNPILPFVRGDGTGPDIWAASVCVLDAAVEKALWRREENCVDGSAGR
jgi:isocitrate dehydrogenase